MANLAEQDQQILNNFNTNFKQLDKNSEEFETQYNGLFRDLMHNIVDLHGTTNEGKEKLKQLFDKELFDK